MDRNLLYYPSIEIPNKEWLLSALLYADSISTIVPYDVMAKPDFDDDLRYLYELKVYRPVYIENVLNDYKQQFGEFEKLFIKATTGEQFKKLSVPGVIDQPAMLYHQKLTSGIRYHLKQEGLIKGEGGMGVVTNETAALLYMALLAQYVAKVSEKDLVIPSTDLKKYEAIAFTLTEEKVPAFTILLDNVLPIPAPGSSVKQIMAFKRVRKDELFHFRQYLNSVQEKLRKAETKSQVLEVLVNTQEEIEKGIRDLERTMKEGGIKAFFTSFESLLKLDSPKLFQTLTAAGIVSTPIHPIAGVATGMIGVAGGMVSSYLTSKREIDQSSLAYLFRAQKAGITPAG